MIQNFHASVRDLPDSPPLAEEKEEGQQLSTRQHWVWRKPSNPHLRYYQPMRGDTVGVSNSNKADQIGAPWGLNRISKGPRNRYRFDRSAGAGTWIYVLDSGIRLSHEDFGGRAEFGHDATKPLLGAAKPQPQDLEHGTHVASTAAGVKYGVAKRAYIVDVKVIRHPKEKGSGGDNAAGLNGINWAVQDIQARNRVGRAVLNLSWGVPGLQGVGWCEEVSYAINNAFELGIHVVIAAGNDNDLSDNHCPGNFKKSYHGWSH